MPAARITTDLVTLVGMSLRTAKVEELERLALTNEEIADLYQRLQRGGVVRDALVVSTCNRTELYATSTDPHADVAGHLLATLRDVVGARLVDKGMFAEHARAALQHLMRVACGLDSMVLGEQQILGQVKDAYATAAVKLEPSPFFERAVQSALKIGARSRTETDIGKGAVSTASAAVHLATRIYADLSRCQVAVVGAGDTGRLLAQHFAKLGPAKLFIVNRSHERAQALAREVGGEALGLDALPRLLESCHVVATAARVTEPLVTRAMVGAALAERPPQPLALCDLGMPRNVAPEVNELENVFVHDLSALQHMVDANLGRRKQAVPNVEAMIEDELDKLVEWQRTLDAGPLIQALRESVETMRAAEVERATRGMSEDVRRSVDQATRAVVNKLMHGPMAAIKEHARAPEGEERVQLIRDAFRHLTRESDDKTKH